MTYNITLYVLIHLLCSIWVFGKSYSHFTRSFPILCDENGKRSSTEFTFCLIMSLFGPLSVPAAIFVCSPSYGWSIKARATKDDWDRKYSGSIIHDTCHFVT